MFPVSSRRGVILSFQEIVSPDPFRFKKFPSYSFPERMVFYNSS
ncbi:hypothetical protein LEP1GSC005_3797 [Leptospira santarosai str. ST188]|nr:hypothetical protein LEP1GSC005_3797 [Leptospira santarosai str. ST188]